MSEARADALEDDASEPKEEEDAVAAAYENISKKLESIRNPKDEDSEEKDSDEVELQEWKGPRKPEKDELKPEDEEEVMKNIDENPKKKDDEEEEVDPLDDDDSDEDEDKDEDSESVKDEWKPKENDPLDEEAEDEDVEEEEPVLKAKKDDDDEEAESFDPEIKEDVSEETDIPEDKPRHSFEEETAVEPERPVRRDPEPDTLDDLAEESPMKKSSDDDDEYFIPNLKGSRQNEGEIGYNTPPQRGGIGESYSSKGNYMEGNDPNNFFSQHSQPQAPKRANKFHLLVLVLIGIGVIGFTVYILKGGFGNINLGTSEASPSPSPVATAEPTPTPTPEPEIERGNFTVRVLNGTSTSGLAAKVRDSIKEDGYKTAAPGNASDSDATQTEVRVKEGTESAALLQRLILDLAPEYEAIAGEALDDKAAYDAEVIIGAK